MKVFGVSICIMAMVITFPVNAQDQSTDARDMAIRQHIRAMESSFSSDPDELVRLFESQHFSEKFLESTNAIERQSLLMSIQKASAGAGDVLVELENGTIMLRLLGNINYLVEFTVAGAAPYKITGMTVREMEPEQEVVSLSADNLEETFNDLEAEGFSGVAYIQLDQQVVFENAFGMANREMDIYNSLNTAFGTGSRPIDFTVAGILLLDQQGKLDIHDQLTKHFSEVPVDKQGMTIHHLMTGQSGLPDFFHNANDRDPDLAWIDRETAEQRLLSADLLFEPGTDQRHSHAAFVLLAALVERVSGQSYYTFIREHFLDPAGMQRTGEYGDRNGLSVKDFAAGGGPQFVGLPNIPPNWGPTSWLIKGSGGMYSTLGDLIKFYELVRSDKVLDMDHNLAFRRATVNLDGSDRGFELFSAYNPDTNSHIFLFLNEHAQRERMRQLFRELEGLAGF